LMAVPGCINAYVEFSFGYKSHEINNVRNTYKKSMRFDFV
jgi:hypothetical protein